MKRFFFFLVAFLVSFGAYGQNMSVVSFRLAENDLTANQAGTIVYDQNGEKCALIKIRTSQTGFAFDVGSLGVSKTEQKIAEIWVYVPFGVRRITISHQQLGVIEYNFIIPIKKASTYIMELTTGEVQTIVRHAILKENLIFTVNPSTALLYVNDQIWPLDSEGNASKLCDYGEYTYRVEAPFYLSTAGKIQLSKDNNRVSINLIPNYGTIEVSSKNGEYNGAMVYLNKEYVGNIPFKKEKVSPGSYDIMVVKDMYKQYTTTLSVENSDTIKVNPLLVPNFKEVTVRNSSGSEIWINGVKRGVGIWKGILEYGTYEVEVKKANHYTISKIINVAEDLDNEFIVDDPQPIYGALKITKLKI